MCSNAKRDALKASDPSLAAKDVMTKLGEMWRAATDAEKKPFEAQAAADKSRYEKEKAAASE